MSRSESKRQRHREIGAAGSVQQILADVGIGNMVAGAATISVDDSADNMVWAVTIDANAIKGLAPGDITFDDAAVKSLKVSGGSGNNFIVVNNTPNNPGNPITTLNSGAGNDVVAVGATTGALVIDGQAGMDAVTIGNGPAPTLGVQGILGAVTVKNQFGLTQLTLDDSADAMGRMATINPDSVTGLRPRPSIMSRTT